VVTYIAAVLLWEWPAALLILVFRVYASLATDDHSVTRAMFSIPPRQGTYNDSSFSNNFTSNFGSSSYEGANGDDNNNNNNNNSAYISSSGMQAYGDDSPINNDSNGDAFQGMPEVSTYSLLYMHCWPILVLCSIEWLSIVHLLFWGISSASTYSLKHLLTMR
jgi:hypothetical protein